MFHGNRFAPLRAQGARVQRPLWASTSAKNPAYSDVYYVEGLIGPETVNTVPDGTLKAFRDHGQVRMSLEEDLRGEAALLAGFEETGIKLDDVTQQVLEEGLTLFSRSFEKLLKTIKSRRDDIVSGLGASQSATSEDSSEAA